MGYILFYFLINDNFSNLININLNDITTLYENLILKLPIYYI